MEYIIASMGRCCSGLMTRLIQEATGWKVLYARSYIGIARGSNCHYVCLLNHCDSSVKKTHAHFLKEPNFDYRAIYMYRDIGDIVASLYRLGPGWLEEHLVNLEVNKDHINTYFRIVNFKMPGRYRNFFAMLYLIIGDKFRFKDSMASWRHAKNVLFLRYEDLCKNKEKCLKEISNHLGIVLPDFEIKKAASSKKQLPLLLQAVIKLVYERR